MGTRTAYGNRDAISPAIEAGIIPNDSIIITKEHDGVAEMFFYDIDGKLKSISERTRFLSITEATTWARKYDCRGHVYSVQNGETWQVYVVQEDYSLAPVQSSTDVEIDLGDISCIDGGGAAGL